MKTFFDSLKNISRIPVGVKWLVIIAVGVFAGGSWVFAQVADVTVQACVKKDGITRILIPGFTRSECLKDERLVEWNILGPQGQKGDTGAQGVQGQQGPTGPKGDIGAPGTITTQIIVGLPIVITSNPYAITEGNLIATATCPLSKFVLGGGAKYSMKNGSDNSNQFPSFYNNADLTQSFPSSIDTWQVNMEYYKTPGATVDLLLTAYAICTL